MKKFYLSIIALLTIGLYLSSCSDEDNDEVNPLSEGEVLANTQNQTEERAIPVAQLASGIAIENGTKKNGTAPVPTGSLDFQINTENQEAFLNSGFTINFSSTDNVAGAYIQFKDAEGNNIDGYFDVPLTSIFANARITKNKKSKIQRKRTTEDEGIEIDVDFSTAIEAGTFCYDICVYDDNGNISQIEEVCVEVEAWGGNATIVGEWIFDRYDPIDEDEETFTQTIYCENGDSIENVAYYIQEESEWTFVLNADGSYYERYDEVEKSIDFDESVENCTAIYETIEEDEKYSGYWAFNEAAGTLTVIDFKYENLSFPEENEEYDEGDLYFEGVKAEVIAGELVLTETFTEDGETITEKVIFKKK
ncbi:MAG: hypothetical protein AAGI07_12675 [Bacteroidota bacterium]